ncbi:outer membrane usher protein FimD/PapC [Deinococcus sp. HSC-46F16]|uniref:hypothetical protein n=1 Tax=Deinococcus sp. HSC-46F16 TaxID=2910968 RepID=UPI00209E326C|nr:hypothetical protein [Deinococcus sp. HSC-46F16]MCP2014516.1 outer membrane usher protein FimD/PapC [Deinococcus sp. HSC-46F16]
MRRSPCRSAAALLTAALLCPAVAAPCEAPEALLQVFVQGSDRGTQVVRLAATGEGPVQVLLPPDVLRPGEAALRGERLSCGGDIFVTLAADVAVRYDAGAQTLTLTLPPARLGSRVADFAEFSLDPPPLYGEAGWAVTFGVRGAASYGRLEDWTAGAYADVGTARGGLSGSLGAVAVRDAGTGGSGVQPRALLRYAVTPELRLYGVWNAAPTGEAPGFGVTDFRGVAVEGRGGPPRVLPDYRLDLPLPADVEVQVNGRRLRVFRAEAGSLTLRNVPLPPGGYTLRVLLTDETGTREVEERVSAEAVTLPSGTFAYAAQVGWTSGGYRAGASGQVGLGGGWTVLGSAALTPDRTALSARANLARAGWTLGLGASVGHAPGEGWQPELSAEATRAVGRLTLQGRATLPVNDVRTTTLGLGARYATPDWEVSVGARSGLEAATWEADASVTRSFGGRGNLSLTGGLRPDGWSAGLRTTWTPEPRWNVSAGVGRDQAANLQVRYAPTLAHTVEVAASPQAASLNYAYQGPVRAAASVSTSGASAQVEGVVVVSGGRVTLQPDGATRGVRVQTGIPGIPLLVAGEPVGVTDARGDLLVTRLPIGPAMTLGVDLGALPFGIALREVSRDLPLPVSGVVTLDWRENFREYRWVQYLWAPGQPAAYGEVGFGEEVVLLDEEGNGLTPVSTRVLHGELRGEDGRRCGVTVGVGEERVSCRP